MVNNTHLVVTVHGIRTYGQWQSRLKKLLEEAEPGITVRSMKYGYFSILAFILPFTRWLVTRRFRRQLLNVIQSNSWSRIDLVGHSFGTHMLGWALHGIPKEQRPEIHTIILSGSVLKSNFPWDQFIGKSVKRLVNECGTRDGILLLNQIVVLFTGMAGRIGFNGMTGDSFQNRYYQFSHSDYFLKESELDSNFMRQAWVPLLTTDGLIPEVDCREYPKGLGGALAGIKLWALNNAEPIKLIVWLTPFVLALLYVLNLYNNAEQQRRTALSRQLAAESWLIADQRPELLERSTLMAIESLRLRAAPEANAVLRRNLPLLPKVAIKIEHQDEISSVAISPDGSIFATASEDKTVTVWTSSSHQPPIRLPHENNVTAIAFSPKGRWLASATQSGTVRIWDLKTIWSTEPRVESKRIQTLYAVYNLAFSPNEKVIAASTDAVGDNHGSLVLWEYGAEKQPVELRLKGGGSSVAFSPKGDLVAVGIRDLGALVISANTHERIFTLPHPGITVHVAFSPSGLLGSASWGEKVVKLWSMQTGKKVQEFVHERSVKLLAFSPDGKWLATGVSQMFLPGEVTIWSLANGHRLARMTHSKAIEALAFSRNSQFLASGSEDGRTSIWEIPAGREVSRLSSQNGSTVSVAFSPNRHDVLSHSGRSASLFEFDSRERVFSFEIGKRIDLVKFSPGDGRYLAWTTNEGSTFVLDRAAGGPPKEIPSSLGEELDLSRDGPLLANIALENGNTVNIWNLATGKMVMQLKDIGHSLPRNWSAVVDIALTLDGKRVAIATENDSEGTISNTVTVWDVVTKKRLASQFFDDSPAVEIVFSQKGNLLGVGQDNGTVTVWDIANMENVHKLSSFRHPSKITGLAFSPDGNSIVTSSSDGPKDPGEHRISNVHNGIAIRQVVHEHGVNFIIFSSDGRRLATSTGGSFVDRGEVTVWDADSGAKLSTFQVGPHSGSVAFSQDGDWVTSVGLTGDAVVWHAISGQVVFRETFASPVVFTAFSPDDSAIAIGTEDGKMYVTPWRADKLIAAACEVLTANLTCDEWKDHFADKDKYHATCPPPLMPRKCDDKENFLSRTLGNGVSDGYSGNPHTK